MATMQHDESQILNEGQQAMQVNDDLLDESYIRDPYPRLKDLRSLDPVHWNEYYGGWEITRYRDVTGLLRNGQMSSAVITRAPGRRSEAGESVTDFVLNVLSTWTVFRDPPDHTRLRSLMNKAFTPRTVARIEAQIQDMAGGIIDAALEQGTVDAVQDLALPLPARVIALLLGVPEEDFKLFQQWADDFAPVFLGYFGAEHRHQRGHDAMNQLTSYLSDLVTSRRVDPRDDLMSQLVHARTEEGQLTQEEVVYSVVQLLIAGFETTRNLIANSLNLLTSHPDVYRNIQDRPDETNLIVEEILRIEGPIRVSQRLVADDFAFEGHDFIAGQKVLLSLASANRDSAEFVDPDELNFRRENRQHVAFGGGIHYCLGAPLARLETKVFLQEFARMVEQISLTTDTPSHLKSLFIRGFAELPVALSRS